jgi:hypothetical protein
MGDHLKYSYLATKPDMSRHMLWLARRFSFCFGRYSKCFINLCSKRRKICYRILKNKYVQQTDEKEEEENVYRVFSILCRLDNSHHPLPKEKTHTNQDVGVLLIRQ